MPNLKQNEFMTEEQKDQIRKQLLEERDEIVGEIGALRRREERTTFEVGADFAERAELEAERIVEHQLSMDDAYLIAKVDLALQRDLRELSPMWNRDSNRAFNGQTIGFALYRLSEEKGSQLRP